MTTSRDSVFGYPKGIFLVGGTEFWDRFSYYGMMGLLVLFLSDNLETGGFAWSEPSALRLYGLYTAAIYITPVFGGWLTAKWLGERRAVLFGGILIVLGHFCLSGPAYLPILFDSLSGAPMDAALHSIDVAFGQVLPDAQVKSALTSAALNYGVSSDWLLTAYVSISCSFFGGLGFIMVGTGLLKPAISSMVGAFYRHDDPNKDSAYTVFLVCIFLGGFLANFVAGTLGEKVGWHYGLSAAGVGMALGLGFYMVKQRAWLGDIGTQPASKRAPSPATGQSPKLSAPERSKILVLFLAAVAAVIYASIFYQKGGLLHFIAKQNTDRVVFGFDVPATWLLSISTGLFIVFAPLSPKIWAWLEKRGIVLDLPRKLAFGLAILGLGYLFQLLAYYERLASADGLSSIWWFVPTYLCFGIGEILFWPVSYAAVSRLSPPRYTSLAFGCYYIVFGIGTWLSAEIGVLAFEYQHNMVFLSLMAMGGGMAVLMLLLRSAMNRASEGGAFFKQRGASSHLTQQSGRP